MAPVASLFFSLSDFFKMRNCQECSVAARRRSKMGSGLVLKISRLKRRGQLQFLEMVGFPQEYVFVAPRECQFTEVIFYDFSTFAYFC